MKIFRLSVYKASLIAAMSFAISLPCLAQGYHSSYGGTRVVNQRQTGLQTPSATYIGAGTMSATARGENPNGSAPGLPQVNMGANIRTPGDNVYKPGTIKHQRRGGYRQYQQQRQGQTYYVPGQNSNSSQYQYRSDLGQSSQPQNNGSFTYGNNNSTTNSNGMRRF